MEIFSLVGSIRLDGLDQAVRGVADMGGRFDDAAQRVGKFGEKLQKVGDGVSKAGGKLSTGVTAPLAAVGAVAFSAANESDKATGRIQAQLGITEDKAKELTGTAKELWAQGFGENVGMAADSLALVGQNMRGLSPDELQEATKHALIFSEAFEEDIPASTAAAQVMMNNFGIDSTKAFDIMTRGMQEGGNYSGELLDTLREYAPQFATMGLSAEESMNLLISGADAGAFNLDKVGDAMKEFNIRAQDGSEATADGFKAIGLNADEMGAAIAGGGEKAQSAYAATITALSQMENEQERNAAGVALFGTQWEDLSGDVVLAMNTATDHIGKVEGATNKAGEALKNNFSDRFQVQMRQLGLALEPIGIILMDMAERYIPILMQKVEQLTNWFGSLTGEQQKWLVILGLGAAAAGPLLLVLGSIISTLGGMLTGFAAISRTLRGATVAMDATGGAMTRGRMIMQALKTAAGGITKAVKLLGSGLKLLVKGGITVLNVAFKGLIGSIRLLGVALRFLTMNPIGLAITAIAGLVAIGIYVWKNWDTLGPKITAIFQGIGAALSAVWSFIWDKTKAIFGAVWGYLKWAWDQIRTDVTNRANALKNGVSAAFSALKAAAMLVISTLLTFLVNSWNTIRTRVVNTATALKNGVVKVFGLLKSGAQAAADTLRTGLVNTWNFIKNTLTGIATRLKDAIVRAFNLLKSGVSTAITVTRDTAIRLFNTMRDGLTGAAGRIRDGLLTAWRTIRDRTGEIFSDMKTKITDKFTEIKNAAGELPGKIGGAIRDKVTNATDAMKDLASGLIKRFKEALGINSPSKVFFDMAGWIVKGLANGLSASNLKSMGTNLFKDFAGGALNSLNAIKGWVSGGMDAIAGNFGKGADAAAGWIRQAMAITGVDSSWFNPLMTIAKKESGFNPTAQNNWDINAKRGIPSKGLFQTIGPTFGAYKMPGMNNILNPVDNAVAAIRYMTDRYGSVFNTPGIRGMAAGTGYKGYYKGGVFTGPSVIRVAENSHTPVEAAIPLSGRYMWPFADAIGSRIAGNGGDGGNQAPLYITIEVPVNLNGREIARATAPELDVELARREKADARARGRRL